MAASVGDLMARLMLDTSQFEQSARDAVDHARAMQALMGKSVAGVARQLANEQFREAQQAAQKTTDTFWKAMSKGAAAAAGAPQQFVKALGGGLTTAVESLAPGKIFETLTTRLPALPFEAAAVGARTLASALDLTVAPLQALVQGVPLVGSGLSALLGLPAAALKFVAETFHQISEFVAAGLKVVGEWGGALFQIAQHAVGIAAEFQRVQTVFGTLLGDMAEGERLVERVWQFSRKTPFLATDLQQSVQTLMAFGMGAERAFNTMQVAVDLAARSTLPMDQAMGRLSMALGKLWAQPRAHAYEMRQLTMAGIPAWSMLEAHILKTKGAIDGSVMSMVRLGKVSGTEAVFGLLEGARQKGTAGLAETKTDTVFGQFQQLQNAVLQLTRDFGLKLIEAFHIKDFTAGLVQGVKFLQDNLNLIDPILARIQGAFEAIRTVALGLFSVIGGQIRGAADPMMDMRDIADQWRVMTLQAIKAVSAAFVGFGKTVLGVVGAISPVLETIAGTLQKAATYAAVGSFLASVAFAGKGKAGAAPPGGGGAGQAGGGLQGLIDQAKKGLEGFGDSFGDMLDLQIEKALPFKDSKVIQKAMDDLVKGGGITQDFANKMTKDLGDSLAKAGSTGEARGIIRKFINEMLGTGVLKNGAAAEAMFKTLTDSIKRYEDAVRAAHAVHPEKILPPSLAEQIHMLQEDIAPFVGKGLSPLEKFSRDMEKLQDMRKRSAELSPEAHRMNAEKRAQELDITSLTPEALKILEPKARAAYESMRKAAQPFVDLIKDQDRKFIDLGVAIEGAGKSIADWGADLSWMGTGSLDGILAWGKDLIDLFGAGADKKVGGFFQGIGDAITNMGKSLPGQLFQNFDFDSVREDFIRSAFGQGLLDQAVEQLFSDADYRAAAVKHLEDLQKELHMTDLKAPTAALAGSREAASAVIRFRNEGRQGDPVERLIDLQKQANLRQQRQLELAERLEKRQLEEKIVKR